MLKLAIYPEYIGETEASFREYCNLLATSTFLDMKKKFFVVFVIDGVKYICTNLLVTLSTP